MSDKQYSDHDHRTELEKALVSSKPWFERNATTLIYGVAAVLAVAAVYVYTQRQSPAGTPGAREMLLAKQPEDFQEVADKFPNSTVGVWARLRQADQLLGNGISNMFTDRETGLKELDQAEAAYNQLTDRTDVSNTVRERVLIGLARLTEARCDGTEESVNAAINAWKALLNQFEDSIVKEYAEERITRLGQKPTQDFYVWFHAQNPSPDDPLQTPTDGPGAVPQIPGLPELTIPSLDDMTTDEASAPSESTEPAPADDKDAETTETPEKSESEQAPGSETPAAAPEEAPADSSADSPQPESPEPQEDAAQPSIEEGKTGE
jgi:hypothetical protein